MAATKRSKKTTAKRTTSSPRAATKSASGPKATKSTTTRRLRATHGSGRMDTLGDVRPRARASLTRPEPSERKERKDRGAVREATVRSATPEAAELAIEVARAAMDKKAIGIEILDVAGRVDYADVLVLMTGRSDRHVASLAQAIEKAALDTGRRPMSVEGLPRAEWVLIDLSDVVVHVFQEQARSLYDIEGLWNDARRVPPPADADPR